MKRLILISACVLLTIASCKKDDNKNTTPTMDAKGYLTTGTWKMTDQTVLITSGDTTYVGSSWDDVEECNKDNLLKFNNDGTVAADQGVLKCNASAAQTSSGTWELLNDNTQLKLNDNTVTQTVDIVELNATTLKYKISGQLSNYANYTATTTYRH